MAPLHAADVPRPDARPAGESGCRTGKHVDWPAEGRVSQPTTPTEAVEDRQTVIHRDSHPVVTELHANRRA